MERFFLYDDVEDTKTRFVSFTGKTIRYDLAILQSSRFFGKGARIRHSIWTICNYRIR